MGQIHKSEVRIRSLELVVGAMLKRMSSDEKGRVLAEAFCSAMKEQQNAAACVGVRRLAEESERGVDDRHERE